MESRLCGMPEEWSDAELLAGVSRADEAAFREIVRLQGNYLYGIAWTLTGSVAEAEDAVQETLTALLSAKFRGEASLKTFLVSILVRQAALIRRKRRGWLRLATESVEDRTEEAVSDQQAIDAKLDLAGLLERLSPEHREVLVMRELQGMSYDEIAKVLSVPRGTIESRLHRAREKLAMLWKM